MTSLPNPDDLTRTQLRKLRPELETLLARVDLILRKTGGTGGLEGNVFDALVFALKKERGVSSPPFRVLQSSDKYAKFRRHLELFDETARRLFKPEKLQDRIWAYRLLWISLIRWLQSAKATEGGVFFVISVMPQGEVAVDNAYPGYVAGGLGPALLRKFTHPDGFDKPPRRRVRNRP